MKQMVKTDLDAETTINVQFLGGPCVIAIIVVVAIIRHTWATYAPKFSFFFLFSSDHHCCYFPAQLVGGFTLSDLLDKPWSQVPSLSPLGTCLHFLSRIGFSIPRCVLQVWRFSESGHHFHLPGSQIRLRDHMTTYRMYSGLRISTVYLRDLIVTCGIHSSWLAASNCRLSGSPIVFRDPQQCRLSYSAYLDLK